MNSISGETAEGNIFPSQDVLYMLSYFALCSLECVYLCIVYSENLNHFSCIHTNDVDTNFYLQHNIFPNNSVLPLYCYIYCYKE